MSVLVDDSSGRECKCTQVPSKFLSMRGAWVVRGMISHRIGSIYIGATFYTNTQFSAEGLPVSLRVLSVFHQPGEGETQFFVTSIVLLSRYRRSTQSISFTEYACAIPELIPHTSAGHVP